MRLAFALLLAGCFTSSPPPAETPVGSTPPPAPKPAHHLELSMARTPCMGSCPTYTVRVHDDSSIEFLDQGNTDKHVNAKLSPPDRTRLLAMIEKVHFFELNQDGSMPEKPKCRDNGDGTQTCSVGGSGWGCSDTSSAILEIKLDGKSRRTDNAHCHEQPIDQLEELIDEVTGIH